MKKILKLTLLLTAFTNLLTAEVVFDLGAQQFYYCVTDKVNSNGSTSDQFVESSYDVGDVIVSTALISELGHYRAAVNSIGHFGVRIKNPKSTSGITFNIGTNLGFNPASIELLSQNGSAVNIIFNDGDIRVGNQVKSGDFSYSTHISGAIEINAESIKIIINGRHVFTILDKPNFNLAKVDVSLSMNKVTNNNVGESAKLNSLVISND